MITKLHTYVAALALWTAFHHAEAAITTAPKKGSGNRFLFVVDTSSSMERLDERGRQAVFDVVYSGIEGRIRSGDTFGVWTFGREVKAGVFPMETWLPDQSTELAKKVSGFLKEQSSGRKSQVEVALTHVENLAKTVRDVDVLIVSGPGAQFKPEETWALIHQNWKGRIEEARKNKKAIIIALAVRSGRIAQATLTLQGERLQLAAPPERKPAQTAARRAVEPPSKAAREPIIIRGTSSAKPIEEVPSKFTPPPVETPAPDPVANPLPEPSPLPVVGTENPIVKAPLPEPEITVAAREPGTAPTPTLTPADPPASSFRRMLIIAGATFTLIVVVFGAWMIIQARSRNRSAYIPRPLTGSGLRTDDGG